MRVGVLLPCLTNGGFARAILSLARMQDRFDFQFSRMALLMTLKDKVTEQAFLPYMPVISAGDDHRRWQELVLETAAESDVLLAWGFERQFNVDFGGKPVVVMSLGCDRWTKKMVIHMAPHGTHFMGCSKAAASLFPSSCNPSVIYSMVEANRIGSALSGEAAKGRLGFEPDDFVLAHIGRFSPDKNPLLLAGALKRLGRPYRGVFLGGSSRSAPHEFRIRTLYKDAVILPYQEFVGDVYRAADAIVMASPSEGCSQVVGEAWFLGVPVISTPVGAVPELEATYGPLVTPIHLRPSVVEIEKAIGRIYREAVDRARSTSWLEFNPMKIAGEWNRLFERVCK